MVGGNDENQFRQCDRQNVGNQNEYNAVQNVRNQHGNSNVVAAWGEGNSNENNAWIQLQAEEFDLMAAAGDLDRIEKVNANCILMDNLQQASTSSTQTNKAPIYDSDGSVENDREDIEKLGAKGDIGFFIGYSANHCSYRVYNRRTKKIMETMNVTFDEFQLWLLNNAIQNLGFQSMTSGKISSRIDLTYALSIITSQKLTEREFDLLFKAMYDDYIGGQPTAAPRTIPATLAP
uniref:Putative RNA-directed DNA polymerase n=1 Tax=Tanacetum cinerariifolium TaxID=118510 RepID=A0A699HNQ5_TANCI|nr:putative RNA-directed DNA polymerase [Tanacetum cinerariifolium]GEY59931.1 putative RNA-directed DNA polymerase [Tanacetum cinerariifolium]